MKFLEKDLEEIIYNTYNDEPNELTNRGLFIQGIMKRQLRIGNYGIADLVTFKRCFDYEYDPYKLENKKGVKTELFKCCKVPKLIVTVYELKKDRVGISAYLQGIKYLQGINRYLHKRNFTNNVEYNLVLIGKEIDESGSFCFITKFNENIKFYSYDYDFNGINFIDKYGYVLSNENL